MFSISKLYGICWHIVNVILLITDKIEQEDLEDYISEILYNEFDTVVEDGSLEKVNRK